jgi:hypothetical protein
MAFRTILNYFKMACFDKISMKMRIDVRIRLFCYYIHNECLISTSSVN